MYLFDTVYEYGEAEYIIEKSRFIAHVMPVGSFDEGKEFAALIKEQYRDATHNVPAIVCGRGMEYQWASDDGEPGGTSGLPVLKLITSMGLTDTAVVVTRYFGGIKLGTGGLARAYTAAAKLGIEAAGVCEVRESVLLRYRFDYSFYSKLQNLASERPFLSEGSCTSGSYFEITEPVFSDAVETGIRCLSENADEIKGMMNNLTNGKAVLINEQKDLLKILKK